MKRSYVCTALMIMLLTLFICTAAEANTYYKVKKGDTLSRISIKFKVPVGDLRASNNLESDDLSVGKKLIIPSKKSSKSEKTTKVAKAEKKDKATQSADKRSATQKNADSSARSSANLSDGPTDSPTYEYHIVKKGDTPTKIAKEYGLSLHELKRLNHLTSSKLKTGRKLIVGISSDEEDDTAQISQPSKGITVSEKIEEVKTLSQSEELSKLSATERLMLFAKKMLDLPYKFGGNGIFGLDCSSFVQKVYSFVGQPLPRSAREQYQVGEAINKDDLQSGDLIFFRTYASFPSHVGIYLGNNLFIHASSRAKKVQIDSLNTPYYLKRFIGAKRPLPETDATLTEIKATENLTP